MTVLSLLCWRHCRNVGIETVRQIIVMSGEKWVHPNKGKRLVRHQSGFGKDCRCSTCGKHFKSMSKTTECSECYQRTMKELEELNNRLIVETKGEILHD